MEIITQFLAVMQALKLLLLIAVVVAGTVLVIVGLTRKKKWLIAAGLALGLGPFVLPWLSNQSYQQQIAARRDYVRNLPKIPLPADFPRRLVIEGDLSPYPAGWFVAGGYVDEVDIADYASEAGATYKRFVAAGDTKVCRAAALAIFDPDHSAGRERFAGNPYDAIKACTRDAGAAATSADAVVLRLGNKTQLFDRENARRRGAPAAIQLSLRSGGREALVHYDEMPILAMPASATRLLPDDYDYPCRRFAELQIVANLLDAARRPREARGLMQRGSARQSEYDTCIASVAPRFEEEDR